MPKTDQSVRTAYLYDDDGGNIVLFILILVVSVSSFNAHILARHREIVAAEPWALELRMRYKVAFLSSGESRTKTKEALLCICVLGRVCLQ